MNFGHLLNTLISYWKMDEASGFGTLADSNGTNTLTALGLTAAAGKINNAQVFNASASQSANIPSNASLQMGATSCSISAWINIFALPASGQGYSFVSKAGAAAHSYEYELGCRNNAGTTQFVMVVESSGTFYTATATTPAISINTWYHVVGWFDFSTGLCHIRVNDTATFDSLAGAGSTDVGTADFVIGARNYTGSNFFADATIDEVGLWKRVLTAIDITALYNGGAGLPFSSFTT
jgi:hypothetical protein